jgi:ribosomal 30S subunit maturation factor RimM
VLVVDDGEVLVVASKRAGGRPVVRVDRELPRGSVLSVRREDLAPPEAGSYYVADLAGLAVEEEGGRALGHVHEVTQGVANDVLELDSGLSLPLHEACVLDVDLKRRTIVVARGFADAG